MGSLDSLPPDQRAVLQLVLQRGRGYDDIAAMLKIDRAAVRERALAAFDALGPSTRVPPERRALITDYLLGQLPDRVAEETRARLGEAANERAWARVVASELGTVANGPLPEIPVEPVATVPEEPVATAEPAAGAEPDVQPVAVPLAAPEPVAPTEVTPQGEAAPAAKPSSRRGGILVLAGLGVLLIAAIVFGIVSLAGGGSSKSTSTSSSTTSAASASTTGQPTTTTTTSSTSTSSVQPLARVILTSPDGTKSLVGAAVVIAQGTTLGIVIRATGLKANSTHDAYAVWLYNSQTDNHLLGFVNPGVKTDGVLQAGAPLPSNVSHFKQLLVTLETQAKPHGPGKIILKGALNVP